LALTQEIPPELIVLDSVQYAEYIASIAAIKYNVEKWQAQPRPFPPSQMLIAGMRRCSPVALIRQALEKCPNEFPASSNIQLDFISENELRERLVLEISAVEISFANLEWKAATVLAGSVIEALLFWVLEEHFSGRINDTVVQLVATNVLKGKPRGDLDDWGLHLYAELAAHLNVIEKDTAELVRLAKDYRNLIHPGRIKRKRQVCNRSTAATAIAALDRVTEDLTKKFSRE
jgi:hypothetical protein